MLTSEEIKTRIKTFREQQATVEGVQFLMAQYDLSHPLLKQIVFREEESQNSLLLTAEGSAETGFRIRIPRNILNFDLDLVVNLLMHEIYHLHQRSGDQIVDERIEREWQAYTEMIFHQRFPQLPTVEDRYLIGFAKKALHYYSQMGEGSTLQKKYASQKTVVEQYLEYLENKQPKSHVEWADFEKLDMRVGTILEVNDFPKARKPSYQLLIDFGEEIGTRKSSAQITALYKKEELVGRQIMANINFAPKQIANFMSECLVMGVYHDDHVVLLDVERAVPNGSKVGQPYM
ncbi:tRNA-binding protein [Vaginella massiliensis]|uniref:tRNA-binding protein n=1 Tax=Vaginella massiliensis TaxID=1816680 RepID=UPI0037533E8C